MKFQYYVQSMVTNSKSFNLDNYSAPEFIAFLGYKNQLSMFLNSLKISSFRANIKLLKDEPRFVYPQLTSFIFGKYK
nr:hypothetical protein [Francisella noatunensis subsp. noatunensis]